MTIVAVYNMKGGVGKTTCAVNLAYLAAASGRKTLIWDLDAQAAATFALRVRPEHAEFGKPALRNAEAFTDAIRETDYLDLDLLPADFSYRNLDRFLDKLDDPKRAMQRMLAELRAAYPLVLLDCPAGFSALSEAVIACADVLLVPTIPTTLSMRTLLRLTQSLDATAPALLPFVSMVDRRKALHCSLSRWAERHPELFLRSQIPYASSVEQMTVRRAPVAIYDARDPATRAFSGLWREVEAHLAQLAQTGAAPMAAPAVYAETLDELLRTLIADADVHAAASPRSVAHKDEPSGLERDGPQVWFAVDAQADFEALERALDKGHSRRVASYLAHTFDTDDAALRRAGYRIQLIEEPGRFLISVLKSGPAGEGQLIQAEQRSAKIDGGWAAKVLTGQLSPVTVIQRRIRHPLAADVQALVADRRLARVQSSEHRSLRLGPVEFAEGEQSATLYLEFDSAEATDAEPAYCVVASGFGGEAVVIGRLLDAWRKRAGMCRAFELPGSALAFAQATAARAANAGADGFLQPLVPLSSGGKG